MTRQAEASTTPRHGSEEDEEEGLDLEGVKDRLGFVFRAPRRHPWLAACAFLVVSGLGVTVAITMPRVYNSTARLLEQKTAMLPALGNPNLPLREGDFGPTKDVGDVIRRRENIIELVKDFESGRAVLRDPLSRAPLQGQGDVARSSGR